MGSVLAVVLAFAGATATDPSVGGSHDRSTSTGLRRTTDSAEIAAALTTALTATRPAGLRADEWSMVARLYGRATSSSTPSPLWLSSERIAPRAAEFAALLAAVDTLGLRPGDYAIDDVHGALRAATSADGGAVHARELARADVRLTASFVALVHDLLVGRTDPLKVERAWHIAPRTFDVGARIGAALAAIRGGGAIGETLAALRPDYGSYGGLLRALARYRSLDAAGGWPSIPGGATIRTGDVDPRVAALRRRLAAEEYLASPTGSDTMDATVASAVAAFQRQHGLTVDTLVGPGTRAALDITAAQRVRQIEANIERLRWLPPHPGERFVVVNVPAFSLYAFDGGERVLSMRVVVGDELVSRRTPIFADTMEYIEFGPYWNVPRSIAVNEILPQARRDRAYLARNNYRILRGWGDNAPAVDPYSLSNAALFSTRYRVRQDPGPDNALGRVKFMFPNDFAVYLHDTPARSRFEQADRALSHGCVRVADPEALAAYVLYDRTDWPRDRIAATLEAGRRVRVDLTNGPPVYLIYLTAFAQDGVTTFRDDIYDRDTALLRALAARTRRS
jgi:murein L,D-transpeptidase YcbB/YkuD